MTTEEKQAFLADVHVGVLALNEPGRGPLTVPVWYDYEPGGDLWFVTGKDSRKGRLMEPGKRISLCAQTEEAPYSYVMVEGAVTAIDAPEGELEPMAARRSSFACGRSAGSRWTTASRCRRVPSEAGGVEPVVNPGAARPEVFRNRRIASPLRVECALQSCQGPDVVGMVGKFDPVLDLGVRRIA